MAIASPLAPTDEVGESVETDMPQAREVGETRMPHGREAGETGMPQGRLGRAGSNVASAIRVSLGSEFKEIETKLSFTKPQRHRLPTLIMYTITITTAVCVAMTNYVIRVVGSQLLNAKLNTMQNVIDSIEDKLGSAVFGALALGGFCMLFAACSSFLVVFIAPQCAGSGLPEIKGYLNGNPTPIIFRSRCFPVAVGGIILSTAAGFPIGREGPMVSIGGLIGFRMAQLFGARFTHHRIRINKDNDKYLASFYDVDRMQHAKRIGSTLGGAAGIAAAFNAPIGGILYMFEEVTATSWSHESTFRAFVCTLSVAGISRGLLNLEGDQAHTLLVYDASKPSVILNPGVDSWTWTDVPFFILLAAAIGLFSAMFARALFFVWARRNARRKHSYTKQVKIAECMLYALVCATIFALLPLMFECVRVFDDADQDNQGDGGNHLNYMQHTCKDGSHAEVATLLLNNAEEAVKHLFSREGARQLRMLPLAVSFLVYTALAIGMPGIPIPMGMFVPSMLLGALAGRFLGEALTSLNFTTDLSHPGIYALTGSAAMLSGFTHMTIAIVVLLLEAAHDLSLIAPLMLGSSVSYLVSQTVNSHGYDEKLIEEKGIPYLDATLPRDLDKESVTAVSLCETIPPDALLPVEASFVQVEIALACREDLIDFPILDDTGRCIGLTTRKRLEAAIAAYEEAGKANGAGAATDLAKMWDSMISVGKVPSNCSDEFRKQPSLWTVSAAGGRTISIDRIMDAAPHTILEDMPAARFYPWFTSGGVNVACVISRSGVFIGTLSRDTLVKEQAKAHLHAHSSGDHIFHEPNKAYLHGTCPSSTSSNGIHEPNAPHSAQGCPSLTSSNGRSSPSPTYFEYENSRQISAEIGEVGYDCKSLHASDISCSLELPSESNLIGREGEHGATRTPRSEDDDFFMDGLSIIGPCTPQVTPRPEPVGNSIIGV